MGLYPRFKSGYLSVIDKYMNQNYTNVKVRMLL